MTLASTGTHVEVETLAGRVRGAWRGAPESPDASAAFLGIPFAEAPVGDLRFAAPEPKRPWEGVLDALEYAATAQRGDPGVTLIPEPSIPGESTLNVNVFTPAPATAAALPVLVYIHGGGYFAGSPAAAPGTTARPSTATVSSPSRSRTGSASTASAGSRTPP